MTHEEQIASLAAMLEIQIKLQETAVDMLKPAVDTAYQKGYSDAMGWKTQNHLEHLPNLAEENEALKASLYRLYAVEAERDRARDLLERCENEMRYAGWAKFDSDNTARNGVYEQVKKFLK